MPNTIIFSESKEDISLRKGDFYLGIGDVGKGPTSLTGFYNGYPVGNYSYIIYLRRITNIFPRSGTTLAFTSAYNATSYGFGAATNIQQVFQDELRPGSSTRVTKVSRIESNFNQYDYVYVGLNSPQNSTRIVSFWYYGTYGTQIQAYNNDGSANLSYLDASKNWVVGSTAGFRYVNIPVNINVWQKIVIRIVNNGTTGVGWSWLILHNNQISSTLANTEYWAFSEFIYEQKPLMGPAIYACLNDAELILRTNQIDRSTIRTTKEECFSYFANQSDKMLINKEYEPIVTNGLVLNSDARFLISYPGTGATWSDISSNQYNKTLVNGPIFNSSGWLTFDGINDRFDYNTSLDLDNWSFQSTFLLNFEKIKSTQQNVFAYNSAGLSPGSIIFELTYSVSVNSILIDNNGNIFFGGRITEYNDTSRVFIVKTDISGNLNATFSTGLTLTQTQDITGLQLDAAYNLYYVGYNFGNLVRISATSGSQLQAIATVNATITQANLLLDSANNKAYIGGWFSSIQGTAAQRIARLNMPGMTIDTSFNTTTGFVNLEDVQMMTLQSDGKLIVGGSFTSYKGSSYNRIIRLNSDATIDTSFNPGTGFDNTVNRNCIAIQSDGKIIVGGNFTTYNGTGANRIIRLNSDGSIDTGFVYGTGFGSSVSALAIDSNGKIVVAGSFTSYNGSTRNRIIRLNTDGSIDTGFSIGTGFDSSVGAIAIQSDGKILVGGAFSTYNGSTTNQICRLNSDGTIDSSFSSGTGILGGYRLNCQLGLRNSSNTLTSQSFFSITRPTGFDWRNYETAVSPFLGRFINWTITKNSSNQLNLYWNGLINNTTTISNPTNLRFQINRSGTMKGNLAKYSIYNKQLSQDEILQNYYQSPIVNSGLLHYWDSGNLVSYPVGSTTSYSLVGTFSGSLQNGVGFYSQYGGFWTFDGSNDRILLSSSINMGNGSTPWTISAWGRTTTNVTGLGQGTIISNQSGGPVYSSLCVNSGKICYWVYKTSWVQYLGNTTINTGNWVNLVWRNNGSNTMTFFVNGVSDGTVSDSSVGGPATNPLDSIGRGWVQNSFAGDISLLMVYNSSLSQAEISQNFNAHRSRFGI
jgi:uncharacterized delta-60 repeat protein